ncbi:MAG: dTMP kinase [Planctomycetota bacterium]
MAKSGIFIVVDGIDGAGKTTQVQRFCDLFRRAKEEVLCSKEPTSGRWGQELRRSAQAGRLDPAEELDLFIRDRQEHVTEVIQPALDAGSVVIVDRYFYSTIAYQGTRGADVESLSAQMRDLFPIPDMAFFLDLPVALAMERIESERGDAPNEFEKADALQKCRAVFESLAHFDEVELIDSRPSIDDVTKAIGNALRDGPLVKKRCRKPYECDPLYCAFRKAGECEWANLSAALPA